MDKIILDGQEITRVELTQKMQEAKKNREKITEISSGVYKTLQWMD